MFRLPSHQPLLGEEGWEPQRPGELLPEDALLSAKAVSLAGWAVNAFGAGLRFPPTPKEQDARLTRRRGRGATPHRVPWTP